MCAHCAFFQGTVDLLAMNDQKYLTILLHTYYYANKSQLLFLNDYKNPTHSPCVVFFILKKGSLHTTYFKYKYMCYLMQNTLTLMSMVTQLFIVCYKSTFHCRHLQWQSYRRRRRKTTTRNFLYNLNHKHLYLNITSVPKCEVHAKKIKDLQCMSSSSYYFKQILFP